MTKLVEHIWDTMRPGATLVIVGWWISPNHPLYSKQLDNQVAFTLIK